MIIENGNYLLELLFATSQMLKFFTRGRQLPRSAFTIIEVLIIMSIRIDLFGHAYE